MIRLWGLGCWHSLIGLWGRVAGLAILQMHKNPQLSSTGSSDHTGSSRSAVQRYSSSSMSTFYVSIGVLSNVRCQQTPSQNGKLLGHLSMKGEIVHCVTLYSAGLKEASVVNGNRDGQDS